YVQTGYVPTAPLQVPPVMVAQVPQEGIDFNRQVINPGQALPTTGRPFFNPFELDANIIDLRRNPGFSNTFLKQGAVAFAPTAPAAPAKSMPVPPSKSWPGS